MLPDTRSSIGSAAASALPARRRDRAPVGPAAEPRPAAGRLSHRAMRVAGRARRPTPCCRRGRRPSASPPRRELPPLDDEASTGRRIPDVGPGEPRPTPSPRNGRPRNWNLTNMTNPQLPATDVWSEHAPTAPLPASATPARAPSPERLAMASATARMRRALSTWRFSIIRPLWVTTPLPAATASSKVAISAGRPRPPRPAPTRGWPVELARVDERLAVEAESGGPARTRPRSRPRP